METVDLNFQEKKGMSSFEISPDEVASFGRDGFVIVRGLFDQQEMEGLLAYAKGDRALDEEAYIRSDASGGQTRLTLRNDLDDRSVYSAIVRSRRMVETMQKLLGDEVYHYHHKMSFKEPRIGGAWEWHQDYGYWYNFGCLYPDMASCMIAVDRATKKNGCLQVLRGSHKMGRVDHVNVGQQVGADPERVEVAARHLELVYCEMDAGDAVFFHSNLLHRSDANESDDPRWTLICCYNSRHNDPYITDGRHPNYSPLEVWPDERVLETIKASV